MWIYEYKIKPQSLRIFGDNNKKKAIKLFWNSYSADLKYIFLFSAFPISLLVNPKLPKCLQFFCIFQCQQHDDEPLCIYILYILTFTSNMYQRLCHALCLSTSFLPCTTLNRSSWCFFFTWNTLTMHTTLKKNPLFLSLPLQSLFSNQRWKETILAWWTCLF